MQNFVFKNYILTQTNPYKSIEQYKIFFKNKFFGVNFNDDDLEIFVENNFEIDLENNLIENHKHLGHRLHQVFAMVHS